MSENAYLRGPRVCFLSLRERHDFSQSMTFRNQYFSCSTDVHHLTASRSPCSLYALVLPRQTPFRFHYMSDAIALKVNHRHCVIVTRITKQNVGVRFASDSSKRGPRLLWYMGSSHLVSAISCDRVQPTQDAGLDSAEPGGLGSLYGQFEDRMITLYRCGQNHNPIIQCTVSVLNTRSGTNGAGESKVTVTSCVASRYFQYKPISASCKANRGEISAQGRRSFATSTRKA